MIYIKGVNYNNNIYRKKYLNKVKKRQCSNLKNAYLNLKLITNIIKRKIFNKT